MSSIIRVDNIQTSSGGSATASGLGIGGVGKIVKWLAQLRLTHFQQPLQV